MSDSYDVIVIGSGAGSGTLVHHLAPCGKRILPLKRGDWRRREPAELAGGAEAQRALYTFLGVGLALIVMLLVNQLQKRTATKAAPHAA
jgi:choline dehydrogenase-like flavoprotein